MKRKIFELNRENEDLIVCDNNQCNYKIAYTEEGNLKMKQYINLLCPKCGENLLTEDDYNRYNSLMKVIHWVNKWFSWLLYIFPNDEKKVTVSLHKKLAITHKDD